MVYEKHLETVRASVNYMARDRNRLMDSVNSLRVRCQMMEARLVAAGLETVEAAPDWALELTGQELMVMTGLLDRYPRGLDVLALDQLMPRLDHARERDLNSVNVIIGKIRAKLGYEAIETMPHGAKAWRCGGAFHEQHGRSGASER